MKRLHGALAIVAALLAAAAGAVDRGPIGQHRRNSIQTLEFISAPELAGRVIRGDRNLRVFDLRSQSAFEQFHVPGARPLSPHALVDEPLTPSMSIVLYGDGRATLADALRVLRGRNHTDVRILREGTFEWLGRVHEPRLAVDATPEERAEFERAAEMSRFFGGVPRAGVPREEVPQGYWTGKASITAYRDLDTRGWLNGVSNFSFHKHLPHYAVTTEDSSLVKVLATQPIDMSKPHPFTEAGHREFNSFVWMPPASKRGGEILLADSTVFSTLFGADDSLKRFWTNLATVK